MAYDPSHEAALDRIKDSTSLQLGSIRPITGIREYELKLGYRPTSFTPINSAASLEKGERAFLSLMSSFNRACKGVPSTHFDPMGLIPNDYILVSLGLDTVKTLPAAEFFLNQMQYRLRFPLHIHQSELGAPLIASNNLDANMKDLLSSMDDGDHRIELETEIIDPANALQEFKQLPDVPDFLHSIEDKHLKISEVCMTSRTGFFILAQVPNAQAHVLLHGCYDVSHFTTPTMEVLTNKNDPRMEVEFEAKFLLGDDPALSCEEVQKEYINRIFTQIRNKALPLGFKPCSVSKMEDASGSVSRFYSLHAPEISTINSPVGAHIRQNGIPAYLAYALLQGKSPSEVFESVAKDGRNSQIARLASWLPDPQKMLSHNNLFLQQRAVA